MKQIAISACLVGKRCKYNGENNLDRDLVTYLEQQNWELIPFCPEDDAFGTPRPTMDLIQDDGIRVICNSTGRDLTLPIEQYAQKFFDKYQHIDIFIGKSKSPSCGVITSRLYDRQKNLISNQYSGIMAKTAQQRHIHTVDSSQLTKESYEKWNEIIDSIDSSNTTIKL
ncbi:MAG: DUF523 domain-containing protein [Campylobacterales bacterium]|nr:DUF523 domain-containing protein [Campylobacterales bacterium]